MSKLNKEQQDVFDQKLEAALKTAKSYNGGEELTAEAKQKVVTSLMAEFEESPAAKKARLEKEAAEVKEAAARARMHKKRVDVMMPHDKHNPYTPPKV